MRVSEQITALLSVTGGAFDAVATEKVGEAEAQVRKQAVEQHGDLCSRIETGAKLTADDKATLQHVAEITVRDMKEDGNRADH
jgi:F-type H+-transporting ATPase subunit alpha